MEVTEPVFKAFDEFELDDLSRLNELDNHLDKSGVDVDTVCPRTEVSTETQAFERIHMEQLVRDLDKLTKTQRRRLKLHIIDGLTYSQIADKEGCSKTAVVKAVKAGLQKMLLFSRK